MLILYFTHRLYDAGFSLAVILLFYINSISVVIWRIPFSQILRAKLQKILYTCKFFCNKIAIKFLFLTHNRISTEC